MLGKVCHSSSGTERSLHLARLCGPYGISLFNGSRSVVKCGIHQFHVVSLSSSAKTLMMLSLGESSGGSCRASELMGSVSGTRSSYDIQNKFRASPSMTVLRSSDDCLETASASLFCCTGL